MTRCSICGREGADHGCRICGRLVCQNCYLPKESLCLQCSRRERLLSSPLSHHIKLMTVGTALIFVGFSLIILSSILSIQSGEWTIIFFPFVFGAEGGLLAAVMLILLIFFMLFPWLMMRRKRES